MRTRARTPIEVPSASLIILTSLLPETTPDWTALPVRIERCLGREAALGLLDLAPHRDGASGRDFQEEYLEWRTVRASTGTIIRVELTCETPEAWRAEAAAEPARAIATAATFARRTILPASSLFGTYDPFAPDATPAEREEAFTATMLASGTRSAYNDGRRSICCMTQPTNTAAALTTLIVAVSRALIAFRSGASAPHAPTAPQLMPFLAGAAQAGRASDPVLVERVARLAFDGCRAIPAEPAGLWIRGVQHTRLRTPAGAAVPPTWFALTRPLPEPAPARAHAAPAPARPRRLVVEVPPDAGFLLGDLVDVATEQPIRYGGQIAELVQVAVTLTIAPARTSAPSPDPAPDAHRDGDLDPYDCLQLRADAQRLLVDSQSVSPP